MTDVVNDDKKAKLYEKFVFFFQFCSNPDGLAILGCLVEASVYVIQRTITKLLVTGVQTVRNCITARGRRTTLEGKRFIYTHKTLLLAVFVEISI